MQVNISIKGKSRIKKNKNATRMKIIKEGRKWWGDKSKGNFKREEGGWAITGKKQRRGKRGNKEDRWKHTGKKNILGGFIIA